MSLFQAMAQPGADYQPHLKGLRTALQIRRALEPGRKIVQQQQIHDADALIRQMRQYEAAQATAAAAGRTGVSPVPVGVPPAGPVPNSRTPIPMPDAKVTTPFGAPSSGDPLPAPTVSPGLVARALDSITRLQPTDARPSFLTRPLATDLERALEPTHPTKNPRNSTPSTSATAITPAHHTSAATAVGLPLRAAA